MEWKKKAAMTRQTWLEELGRRLVWSFPLAQVKDILADYQEQFDVGLGHGKTEVDIIQSLGTPAEAVALLLEEEPSARRNGLRHNVLWGAVLAVCAAFWWICFGSPTFGLYWVGTLLLHPMIASVLFLLLRGPGRVVLERQSKRRTPRAAVYYAPAAVVLVCQLERLGLSLFSDHLVSQFASSLISEDSFERTASIIRYSNVLFHTALMLLLVLLTVWLLVRCVKTSVRYFPGVLHAFGAFESVLFSFSYYSSTSIEYDWERIINTPMSLLPYCAGLVTALVFQRWVDGRKPLPRFFQGGVVTWHDWRHRLGVNLLGWFPVEQTLEVLEDYQEQYELGREQGKDEDALLAEMGRPETVVRDLLAEDRKARLRRRKTRVWVVLAAAAGWLLLGLLRAFEFGYGGFGWYYGSNTVKVGIFATLLGTAALFFLLHVRERTAVEQRFPAPQTPSRWIWLPPLVFSAVVAGLSLWLICNTDGSHQTPVFLGRAAYVYVVLSIEFSALLLTLLLAYTLNKCFTGSIRYFPAVPYIAGSFAHVLNTGIFLQGMDISSGVYLSRAIQDFMGTAAYPFLAGLLLAVVCRLVLRFAGKPRQED